MKACEILVQMENVMAGRLRGMITGLLGLSIVAAGIARQLPPIIQIAR
jgi:hypothetical protein